METCLPAAVRPPHSDSFSAAANARLAQPWVTTTEPSQLRSIWERRWWILLGTFFFAFSNEAHPWQHPVDFGISFGISLAYFVGLWLANGYTSDWLNRRMGWNERPVRRLLLTVGASLAASLTVIVLIGEALALLLWHRPPSYVFQDNVLRQMVVPLILTVIVSLFMHSRSFLLGWREATVRVERLEKETAVARLDSLRRQVDPHFLFNSLNALTSLVEENDPARAVRFIRQLSQVYRYVLDSESQELVPLADEIAFAESYLYLQKTRLGEALAVDMDLPPAAVAPYYVPPLALQLLLENVLKHNAAYQADPLHLRVTLDPAAHTLTVRNTRRPRRLAPGESSGRGLANLAARYAFLTDKPLVSGEENGEFVVTLPLLVL
ncbi:histidine kinase [Hymenobacter sp. DH14]|uniref:Histidine kinase n=1 Tax=Hymenobacter cyanobacteriorum TaxID=2926463 RepID=A0A9X2AGV3_9BACT|nr:sensor histidine kinase [Hymenobacter cyanobacteriorum]MCI1189232.1 histidine kinase [Hymenobacter cyanobacteriorum]